MTPTESHRRNPVSGLYRIRREPPSLREAVAVWGPAALTFAFLLGLLILSAL